MSRNIFEKSDKKTLIARIHTNFSQISPLPEILDKQPQTTLSKPLRPISIDYRGLSGARFDHPPDIVPHAATASSSGFSIV